MFAKVLLVICALSGALAQNDNCYNTIGIKGDSTLEEFKGDWSILYGKGTLIGSAKCPKLTISNVKDQEGSVKVSVKVEGKTLELKGKVKLSKSNLEITMEETGQIIKLNIFGKKKNAFVAYSCKDEETVQLDRKNPQFLEEYNIDGFTADPPSFHLIDAFAVAKGNVNDGVKNEDLDSIKKEFEEKSHDELSTKPSPITDCSNGAAAGLTFSILPIVLLGVLSKLF